LDKPLQKEFSSKHKQARSPPPREIVQIIEKFGRGKERKKGVALPLKRRRTRIRGELASLRHPSAAGLKCPFSEPCNQTAEKKNQKAAKKWTSPKKKGGLGVYLSIISASSHRGKKKRRGKGRALMIKKKEQQADGLGMVTLLGMRKMRDCRHGD